MSPERFVTSKLSQSAGFLVPYYLMLSYLYYELDVSLVSDELFDKLCVRLIAEWDGIRHPHKALIDLEGLKAGTGYYLRYPYRVKCAATALWFHLHKPKGLKVGPKDWMLYGTGTMTVYRRR